MATLKRQQTEDEVRQKAVKAFRDVGEAQAALKTAQEMVEVRKQIEKKATSTRRRPRTSSRTSASSASWAPTRSSIGATGATSSASARTWWRWRR
jgi:hypothetical protein